MKNIEKASREYMRELIKIGTLELAQKGKALLRAELLYSKESEKIIKKTAKLDKLISKTAFKFGYLPKNKDLPFSLLTVGLYLSFLQKDSKERLFEVRYGTNGLPEAFRLRTDKSYSYYRDKREKIVELPSNVEKPYLHYSELALWLENEGVELFE